jgi:putative SOS response-associated peptidase YedK
MCNLYSMTSNEEAIRRLFRVERTYVENLPSFPSIFPGQDAPVVRLGEDGARELVTMCWGFVLPQRDKAPKRVTNARTDKVAESRFWRSSFEQRRCLVQVTSFCEWTDQRPKVPHWFGLRSDDEPRPLFAFASLWRTWRGKLRDQLVDLTVMSFLTTTPNDVVRPIHAKAMPVMLTPGEHETWLTGSAEEAHALARPYPAGMMAIVAKGETRDEPPLAAK